MQAVLKGNGTSDYRVLQIDGPVEIKTGSGFRVLFVRVKSLDCIDGSLLRLNGNCQLRVVRPGCDCAAEAKEGILK